MVALYRANSWGFVTVAGPISAVTTGAVPMFIGLATGERPGRPTQAVKGLDT
jgi:hypothetical protein